MTELSEKIAKRGYEKGVITRLHTFALNKEALAGSTLATLEARRSRLEQAFNEYERLTRDILVLSDKDEEDIEAYEGKYYNTLSIFGEAIASKAVVKKEETPTYKARTKLPAIEIPKFTGNYSEYLPFANLFNSVIHKDETVDNVQKLYYLRTLLVGEPYDLIKDLSLTGENYVKAVQLLEDRYNNNNRIVNDHINRLLDLNALPKYATATSLRGFVSAVKQNIAALQNLGVKVDAWDPIIICILQRKLDKYTAREYHQRPEQCDGPQSLADFISFLEKKATALENVEPTPQNQMEQKTKVAVNIATEGKNKCLFCSSSDHKLFCCKPFKLLPATQRKQFANDKNLCEICVNPHIGKCKFHFKCAICKGAHNTIIHDDEEPKQEPVTLVSGSSDTNVLLPTVKVKMYAVDGREVHVKAILDSASQASIVSSKLVQVLGLTPNKVETAIVGVSGSSNNTKYAVQLEVFSLTTPFKTMLNCHVMDQITCRLPQHKIDLKTLKIPPNIQLADEDFTKPSEINMLLSADVFFQVLLPPIVEQVERENGPYIVNTRFGHIVAGALSSQPEKYKVSLLCLKCDSDLNENIGKFWESENVPQTFTEHTTEQDLAETIFKNTCVLEGGRFQVDLPLKVPVKEVSGVLGNSFDFALNRFLSLERKIHKDDVLLTEYKKFIHEFVELGHAHYVDIKAIDFHQSPTYFMPHHAVINQNSKTTKLRCVFDASMKTDQKVSLNDIMLNGPVVQRDLIDIILLFRFGAHTFSTDIRRMFRNIRVNPEQATLQNILWRDDPSEEIKCLQLDTVTYGMKSSSFLATRCLVELANRYEDEFPLASYILKNCTYVDDVLYSNSDPSVIIKAKNEVRELLSKGGFETHKWASNCEQVYDDIPPEKRHFDEIDLQEGNSCMKTLGLKLDVEKDCFIVSCPNSCEKGKITKRVILSDIARFYDPLGFVSPIIVKAKLIMRKLWDEKIGWDQSPSDKLKSDWLKFSESLAEMEPINIERNIPVPPSGATLQIVGFADAASTVGHGACIYARVLDDTGKAKMTLLCSKSRINPRSGAETIPRLELNAALLLSKLTTKVYKALSTKLKIDEVHLFSDSQIVLAWLNTEPAKLQAYVANRVKLIQESTANWHWSYINTTENPADLISRGADPSELSRSALWWHGPEILGNSEYIFNDFKHNSDSLSDLPETKVFAGSKNSNKAALITIAKENSVFDKLNEFSDVNKMTRVLAYVLRFCNNVRPGSNKITNASIGPEELQNSLNSIIKHEQSIHFETEMGSLTKNENVEGSLKPLHPFIDKQGLIRVGGRLQNASIPYSQKHPVILPKQSRVTELIIQSEHIKQLHAGPKLLLSTLNQRYWLINGLRQVKKVTHKCLVCFRFKATASNQLMGSLPKQRVQACKPFQIVGIDFAGPIQIKNSRVRRAVVSKGYICVFVCFTTKAIHLELTSDISTDAFLACFKRFIARRGLPREVFCDNGGAFVGANRQLVELYKNVNSVDHQTLVHDFSAQQGVEFHFLPAYSPVFAGLAEAGVKSTKYHLYRVLGKSVLTYEQTNTILNQIEAVLNSRPLLPLSSDPDDFSYLTPGHFLVGSALNSVPESDVADIPQNRIKFWELCNQIKQQFWGLWHRHYLNILQTRSKWRHSFPNVAVGQMVLLKQPNLPPLCWPLARISKVYPGDDGKVRVVDVVTPNKKIFKRSLSGFCILPLE